MVISSRVRPCEHRDDGERVIQRGAMLANAITMIGAPDSPTRDARRYPGNYRRAPTAPAVTADIGQWPAPLMTRSGEIID